MPANGIPASWRTRGADAAAPCQSGRCTASACGSRVGSCRSSTRSSTSERPHRVVLQARHGRIGVDGHHHGGAGRYWVPVCVTLRSSKPLACSGWRRPSSPGCSPAWRIGRPPDSAPAWHEPPGVRRSARRSTARSRRVSWAASAAPASPSAAGLEHWRPPAGLAGRVVIVTGASSGIGRAVALELGAPRRAPSGCSVAGQGPDRGRRPGRPAPRGGCGGRAGGARRRRRGGRAHPSPNGWPPATTTWHVLVHAAGALFPTLPPCSRRWRAHGRHVGAGTLPPDVAPRPAPAPIRGRQHRDAVLGRACTRSVSTSSASRCRRMRTGAPRPTRGPSGRRSCCPTSGPAAGVPTEWRAMPSHPGWVDTPVWPAVCLPSPSSAAAAHPGRRGGHGGVAGGGRARGATAPTPRWRGHDRHRRSGAGSPAAGGGGAAVVQRPHSGPFRRNSLPTDGDADHLILTVNDRDASVRFYTEVMGFGDEGEDGPFSVIRVSPRRRCSWRPGAPRVATTGLRPLTGSSSRLRPREGGRLPYGDSFHDVGNMQGPGEEAGARAWPTVYLFDPNGTWSSCATTGQAGVHLEHRRRAHAAAGAQRPDPDAAAAPAQLVDQRHQDAGARGAHRVPEPDGATVDVDDVVREAELAGAGHRHGGEGLVDLDQVHVGLAEPGPVQGPGDADGRRQPGAGRLDPAGVPRPHRRQRLHPVGLGVGAGHHARGRRPRRRCPRSSRR